MTGRTASGTAAVVAGAGTRATATAETAAAAVGAAAAAVAAEAEEGDVGSRWVPPRFTRGPSGPDLSVVGTSNYSPASHPLHLVSTLANGNVAYERLFADQQADGAPIGYYYPGTFGYLVPAGRGYRG